MEGNSGGLKVVAVIVGILALGGGAFAVGFSSNPGSPVSNNLGDKPVDVTDPTTKVIIGHLQAKIDSCAALQQNTQAILDLQQQVNILDSNVSQKFSGDTLNQAKAQIAILKTTIQQLVDWKSACSDSQTTITSDQVSQVWTQAQTAGRALAGLGRTVALGPVGSAQEAIDLARLYVEYESAGNHIPRVKGVDPALSAAQMAQYTKGAKNAQEIFDKLKSNGQIIKAADCSGFISYILMAVGAIENIKYTQTFASDTAEFDTIKQYTGSNVVTKDAFSADLANGTIKPGDIIVSGLNSNLQKIADESHVTMVASTSVTDPHGIIQVRDKGPAYDSILGRLGKIRTGNNRGETAIVLRPHYKP